MVIVGGTPSVLLECVQSRQMDLGSRFAFSSVCLMVTCLLRSTDCFNHKISCPPIPPRLLTLNPPEKYFQINETFRYECQAGYVRKAGTSNYIRCEQIHNGPAQWIPQEPSLECIPDPMLTQPAKSTVTNGHADIPHSFTIANTVTATSFSPQTTQKLSPSASVAAEPDRPEPTPSWQLAVSGHSQGTERVVAETEVTPTPSSTTTPLDGTAPNAQAMTLAARTAAIGCGSLAIVVCVLVGIGFFHHRRRSKSQNPPPDEQIPMKGAPPE
ncbi:interleukin-15 receptor subunit alpha isoform 2-T2 [Spinachia spinachia]